MPRWVKILLTIAIVIVIGIVGIIGAGALWWMRNKDALRAQAKEITAEGNTFGRGSDNQGCVDKTMTGYKKEPGFFSALKSQRFLDGCLHASRPTDGFCDRVPIGDFEKMAEWREDLCQHYDLATDRNCGQLVMPIVMFCGNRKPPATSSE